MTSLQKLLDSYRQAAESEREKGTYFEELILCYLRNEATYRDLYSDVWTYSDWAKLQGLDGRDTGIDLVAKTSGTGEYHAIQCKLYAEDYRLQKGDIDSFFTASGKKPFTHRIIIATTDKWSEHAEDALQNQQPPVSKIDLHDLESSQIDWSHYHAKSKPTLKTKKQLHDHQRFALIAVKRGLSDADRGKLIMACGTGKTFTALKIAEELAGAGKRVLFLVPSLNLLSQTLTEWTQESAIPLHSFAVCSDSDVGKKRKKDDDTVQTFTHELRYPATTEPARLAAEMSKRHDAQHMSVVYSTYHSIDVISRAQHEHGLDEFDLIICDEAHRTTGATFDTEDESNFVRVHDADYIRSAKRLYMTATPRIYGDSAKASAEKDNVALCSMDDEKLYGKELFVITFSEAVKRGLLVDYKVIVLAVEETHVNRRIQNLLKDPDNQLKVDDAAKIIGCWKALSKQGLADDLVGDGAAMQRAVAFCQVIEVAKGGKTHKVSSKQIAGMFQAVVEAYQASDDNEAFDEAGNVAFNLQCEAEHVDGSMNAGQKEAKLDWLKSEVPDNVFGMGSRAPIAISLLVKNPDAEQHGQIYFHDIGDYLSQADKLEKISSFASIAGISEASGWQSITPDQHGDWLKQRDDGFGEYIVLGDKKGDALKLFDNFSQGVLTARDAWCYNASKAGVTANMASMIGFYNSEVTRFANTFAAMDKKAREVKVDSFINTNPAQISWTHNLKQELVRERSFVVEEESLTVSLYRPFTKQWLYYNRRFNERVYQMPRIFPDATAKNLVICALGTGSKKELSVLMADAVPNYDNLEKGQCFPLYLYGEPESESENTDSQNAELFAAPEKSAGRHRRDALTDEGLAHFQSAYPSEQISKEDVFYYVYGLLHSPDYRERYADNLSKELPRIPRVKTAADFWAFSQAGRKLADLHLNYETVEPYPVKIESNGKLTDADYRVEKMKYGKKGKDKDLTTLHYNDKITLTGIPLEAYDYIVNGKPALDWVVERQRVKPDPDSGIINDANDWAVETMGNPRYPLELFQRVVTVSLETMKIVSGLPKLEIMDKSE